MKFFATKILLIGALFVVSLQAFSVENVEPRLIAAIDKINQQNIDAALSDVKKLAEDSPTFDLAQLVYADLLMAKAGQLKKLELASPTASAKVNGLRQEAKVRWTRYQEKLEQGYLPDVLLELSDKQKNIIVTDLSRSRLYLFENGSSGLKLKADFYVTHGKNGKGKLVEGDAKTPLGTYFVTRSLDAKRLPDLYGSGAYPIDYPNAWDKRQGNTGHSIWLHGVPSDTYSRVPLDTLGCLAMTNQELDFLKPYLQAGVTPVIITSKLNWVSPEQLNKGVKEVKSQFNRWLTDWRSLDVNAYLKNYSVNFKGDKKDYAVWVEHKQRVGRQKTFVDVAVSNLSILGYGDQADMVVVSYEQDYQSNNFQSQSKKRQYWKKEVDGKWRIIYEGQG